MVAVTGETHFEIDFHGFLLSFLPRMSMGKPFGFLSWIAVQACRKKYCTVKTRSLIVLYLFARGTNIKIRETNFVKHRRSLVSGHLLRNSIFSCSKRRQRRWRSVTTKSVKSGVWVHFADQYWHRWLSNRIK